MCHSPIKYVQWHCPNNNLTSLYDATAIQFKIPLLLYEKKRSTMTLTVVSRHI